MVEMAEGLEYESLVQNGPKKMGRVKSATRKRGGHTADLMKKAVELVKNGMSIRKASQACGLKYPTVRLYVKRVNQNPEARLTPNYEVNKVFSEEEENKLKDYIDYCAKMFYGLTTKDCRRLAYQMAKANNTKMPQSWIDAEMAGIEWLRSFRKRFPEFSLRKPEACSLARATAFNKHNIESFFNNLKNVMERHPSFADGTRIYNLDETSTGTVQRPGKVLARKGSNVSKVTSGERGTLVTTCCIVSATGQALPPAMVFPRKKFLPHMLHGAPPGTLGLAAPSGWINSDLFVDVMKHFIKHTSASKENPALLIMDNHESHLSIEALDLAKSSGVTILTLHPHTTSKVQPLDVGLNGPFKTYYNSAVDSWLLRNPGQPLTIYNIAECVGPAYMKAMTPTNIVNAFKKSGIFPFDDCIFTEEDFMPSTVTDRPLIVQDTPPLVKAANSRSLASSPVLDLADLDRTFCTSPDKDIPSPIREDIISSANTSNHVYADQLNEHLQPNSPNHRNDLPGPNTSQAIKNNPQPDTPPLVKASESNLLASSPVLDIADDIPSPMREAPPLTNPQNLNSEPMPSTSRQIISPMKFMPPIKAKPRDPKRRRTPGKSLIATDTPEKDAIAAKKQKGIKRHIVKKVKQDLFTEDKNKKKKKTEAEKGSSNSKKSTKHQKKVQTIDNDDTSDEDEFIASGSSSGGEEYISDCQDDDEDDKILLNGTFLPLHRDPKEEEFVVVLFLTKKAPIYYVGKVMEKIDDNDDDADFFVSFFRLKSRARQTFCEPLEPDMAGVKIKDIKYILPKPKVTGSSRRHAAYLFDVKFDLSLLNLR